MMKYIFTLLVLLLAAQAEAATYWANPGGGAGSCAAASGTSDPATYRTLLQGLACLVSGDTLMLKNGTYNTFISDSSNPVDALIPNGTSWSSPTTIKAENALQAILNNGNTGFSWRQAGKKYVVLDGLKLNPGIVGLDRGPQSVRFIRGYITSTTVCVGAYYNDEGGQNTDDVNMEIIDSEIMGCGVGPDPDGLGHSIYLSGGGHRVSGNTIHSIAFEGYGVHLISGNCTIHACVIEKNIFHDNGSESGGVICQNTGCVIRQNILYNESGAHAAIRCGAPCTIVNNTIYNSNVGIKLDEGAANSTVRNNIIRGTTGGTGDIILMTNGNTVTHNYHGAGGINDQGTGQTLNNNTNTDPLFVNAAGANFNLSASSPAIDSGVNVGLPCNGPCDRGAIEFVGSGGGIGGFASAQVQSGTPNVLNGVFQSAVDPITDCAETDFAVNVAGGGRTSTNLVHTGGSTFNITFDGAAVTAGQAVTLAYSGTSCRAGPATISTWTAQTVTNNVAGAPAASITLSGFRFRDVYGTEAGAAWKVAAGVNYQTFPGGIFRVRMLVRCNSGPCPATAVGLGRKINGGAMEAVYDGSGTDSHCGDADLTVCMLRGLDQPALPVDGAATTQLIGAGTFKGGAVKRKNDVVYTMPSMASNEEVEIEFLVKVQPTAVVGTTVDLALINEGLDTALCVSGCTEGRITITTPAAGGGT